MLNIGIIVSGFISKGFYFYSLNNEKIKVSKILTRSIISKRSDIPQNLLTNDIEDLIKNSDIVLECSGDTIYATNIVSEVIKHKIPILTMNSEFHITVGNYFYTKGVIGEAEGDQSGCLYRLNEELLDMGFNPLVYGNYKKYLKHNVSKKQALYWTNKNNISLDKTVSFTDGSKVEIENVFLANSLDLSFHETTHKIEDLQILIDKSINTGKKYIDYFLDKKAPCGVFIVANHDENQKKYLKYLKFNEKHQIIQRPFHFCHLEIYKSIKRIVSGDYKLMQNTHKKYMVASLSKRKIKKDSIVSVGLGGFDFRGVNHKYNKNYVPITLLKDVIIKKDIEENHILTFDDIYYNDNLAFKIWREDVK